MPVFAATRPALARALACALFCAPAAAYAQDGAAYTWTLGGFGSIGAVHSSERRADFAANVLNPGRAGYTRRWSADVDSRLGAQAGVQFDERWSAVLQVVSERNLDGTFRPKVEWANLKYQATQDLSVRVGRIALPMMLASDYRKASYALPWVRPPVEVYGSVPISNSDGVDLSYRWSAGDLRNLTQVLAGRIDFRLNDTARLRADELVGFSNSTTAGALTVVVSGMRFSMSSALARDFFDAFRRFGPQGAAIADRYDLDRAMVKRYNVGASYDTGDWFVMGELGRVRADSFFGDKTPLYFSAGIRHGNLTPYATYGRVRANAPTRDPGLSLAGLPPPVAALAAGLNANLNGLLSTIAVQHSVAAGLRWDFRPDYAIKLQYDRIRTKAGSSGMLINVQPGFMSGKAVHVASVSLDFVF
ncbi:MAG TPA: porin [Burkholderiaceae bacterium]